MKTEIQPDKDNFTDVTELNEHWNSTRQRQFYGRLRIKWTLKFNPTKIILRATQNYMKTEIQPNKDNFHNSTPTKTILQKTQN